MTLYPVHFISIYFNSLCEFGRTLSPNSVQLNTSTLPHIGPLDTHVFPRPLLTTKGSSR